MNFIGIIPARYASTRFPGKPLALIGGKPMIQRVYEQARKALSRVVIATDDERIYSAAQAFGGEVVMTDSNHKSGTDRCYEAYMKIKDNSHNPSQTVIINIQGDEPFVQPEQINLLKQCFISNDTSAPMPATEIATLVRPFTSADSIEDLTNPNTPKVAVSSVRSEALYFSRSIIPFFRGKDIEQWLDTNIYYRHIGMYAYRADILQQITRLPQGTLEKAESLEQLRWLENGYRIRVAVTDISTIGIDTIEDLEKANDFLNQQNRNR